MNFLAADTSGKYLTVLAYRDGRVAKRFLPDCALRHSVVLTDEIDGALRDAGLLPRECDFFAAVVGPGSFTGIRIGISTVKGLCLACDKPALAVTSFDALAYSEEREKTLALVDAGRGRFYACAYEKGTVSGLPAFLSAEETEALVRKGFSPVGAEALFDGCAAVDPAEGLLKAVLRKKELAADPAELSAVYLRRSSAEENRK